MDLLHIRYASPFPFMDEMIQNCRFVYFIHKLIEAKHESDIWDVYIHKVWDKSYSDFKQELETNEKNSNLTDKQKEDIVRDSMNILNNFNPESR